MSWSRRSLALAATLIVMIQIAVAAAHLGSRASGTSSAWQGLPLDDAWIHLVYSRNVAQHFELSYNPGEPEAGFTSPLWVLLLTPTGALEGHAAAIYAKIFGLLLAILSCLLAALLARRLAGDLAGLAAGIVLALDPQMSFAALSGMEVSLASCCMLATLLSLSWKRLALAGLFFGLAFLARPESAVLVIVLLPWIAKLVQSGEVSRRSLGLAICLVALCVTPLILYCVVVTGRPLPNTFYLKSGFDILPIEGLQVFVRGVFLGSTTFAFGIGLTLAVVGARHLIRGGRPGRWALITAPVAFLLGTLMSRQLPLEELDTFYYTRYLLPLLPLVAVLVGVGLGSSAATPAPKKKSKKKKKGRRDEAQSPRRTWLVVAAGLALIATAVLWLPKSTSEYSWNTRNIEEMQVETARWIARETPPDAVIAASDAGAVRFFGERRVIDLMALNYHPAIEVREQGRIPIGLIMREERPTHLAVLRAWFPDLTRGGRARLAHTARAERYTIANANHDEFVVYEVLRR